MRAIKLRGLLCYARPDAAGSHILLRVIRYRRRVPVQTVLELLKQQLGP